MIEMHPARWSDGEVGVVVVVTPDEANDFDRLVANLKDAWVRLQIKQLQKLFVVAQALEDRELMWLAYCFLGNLIERERPGPFTF